MGDAYEEAKGNLADVVDTVGDALEIAKEKLGEFFGDAVEKAQEVADIVTDIKVYSLEITLLC